MRDVDVDGIEDGGELPPLRLLSARLTNLGYVS